MDVPSPGNLHPFSTISCSQSVFDFLFNHTTEMEGKKLFGGNGMFVPVS
jgi:hypothetical protein